MFCLFPFSFFLLPTPQVYISRLCRTWSSLLYARGVIVKLSLIMRLRLCMRVVRIRSGYATRCVCMSWKLPFVFCLFLLSLTIVPLWIFMARMPRYHANCFCCWPLRWFYTPFSICLPHFLSCHCHLYHTYIDISHVLTKGDRIWDRPPHLYSLVSTPEKRYLTLYSEKSSWHGGAKTPEDYLCIQKITFVSEGWPTKTNARVMDCRMALTSLMHMAPFYMQCMLVLQRPIRLE